MKYKILIVLLIVIVGIVFLLFGRGETYKNLNDLQKAQEKIGYVVLGKFGNNWPAKVIEVKTAMDEIGFSLQNGTRHKYPGYNGYKLKVIKLISKDKAENVIVFRSKEKEGADYSDKEEKIFTN